jgi:hypothetical protein
MYTDSIIVTLQTSDNIACHSWFNLIMYLMADIGRYRPLSGSKVGKIP